MYLHLYRPVSVSLAESTSPGNIGSFTLNGKKKCTTIFYNFIDSVTVSYLQKLKRNYDALIMQP